MHRNSTVDRDKIHKVIWDRHPLKGKGDYSCAKCHSPKVVIAMVTIVGYLHNMPHY